MLIACSSEDQLLSALWLCAALRRDEALSLQNAALRGLLLSLQQREQANWCIAVLHYACYPTISWLQKRTELPWEETVSAFDAACETATARDLERRNIHDRLRNLARTCANGEGRADASQAYAESQLIGAMHSHPLEDLFAGLGGDPLAEIDEARARGFLLYLASKPGANIRPQDIEPILKKLFHSDEQLGPTERKRKERAMNRIEPEKAVTKTATPGYGNGSNSPKKGTK